MNSKVSLNVEVNGLDKYREKLEELSQVVEKFNELVNEINELEIDISYKFPLQRKIINEEEKK